MVRSSREVQSLYVKENMTEKVKLMEERESNIMILSVLVLWFLFEFSVFVDFSSLVLLIIL